MSWRGQGGRRAKGRRGGQDPEVDNSAWLAELEREAAQAGDDEDDWASTLRGRRSSGVPPPTQPPPSPVPPASDSGWSPTPDPSPPPPPDHGLFDADPGPGTTPWAPDPAPQDPSSAQDPDWSSWRQPAPDPFEAPQGQDWGGSRGSDHGQGWQPAGVDTPTGAWSPDEPVGREPDYPALFGELYRRRSSEQDPIWEAPPATEPLPDQRQPDPPSGSWPFEDTTGSWEPSDRSFIWPPDELPATQPEWDQPAPQSWLDEPAPPPAAPSAPSAQSASDDTAFWSAPAAENWADPEPDPRDSPWASQPGAGNGASPAGPGMPPTALGPAGPGMPAPTGPLGPLPPGPPPADWAAAIPTDVPAAERAGDPGAATRVWRPDAAVEAEPGVPLAGGSRFAGHASAEGDSRVARPAVPAEEPEQVRRKTPPDGRRKRPAGERQARAWPRIVAIISWIVLVMVVCWFYVFPWLERVLPENF
jgi:hypothetical protein